MLNLTTAGTTKTTNLWNGPEVYRNNHDNGKIHFQNHESQGEPDKFVLVQQRLEERFPGLKSSIEHNTTQEFEPFTGKSERGSDSVSLAHSTDW